MSSTLNTKYSIDLPAGSFLEKEIRVNNKPCVCCGSYNGNSAIFKMILNEDPIWKSKFLNEIEIYQTFIRTSPPVRVPQLLYSNNRVLIIEHISGKPVSTERYIEQSTPLSVVLSAITCIEKFSVWKPFNADLPIVFDYAQRFDRFTKNGLLLQEVNLWLNSLLADYSVNFEVNHGDPLLSNLISMNNGELALVDFEYTGRFLPGFDLAMLFVICANLSGAKDAIEKVVLERDILAPFMINLGTVLMREIQIHKELPDDVHFKKERLKQLEYNWKDFHSKLRSIV